jgi:hypothetical protein
MSIIQGNAHTSAGGGYNIERSLRFNSADSAYLNRTPASAGNRKTWTWSGWVKRGALGSAIYPYLITAYDSSGARETYFNIEGDCLRFAVDNTSSGNIYLIQTTQVFRDPSAWYHIMVVLDTTQATTSNRLKMYVNGTQITAFSTANYPAQNYDATINLNVIHNIGRSARAAAYYYDGYMTEVNFIDGQALTPSSFGETDSNTGVWKPKAFSGTYGTNGFYLKFADNSGTTSTTLGADTSGNGNNWTPNNFSVTAGAGNDSLVDSPTSYGTDTGVGGEVRGNYATLNPLDANSYTESNGNLDLAIGAGVYNISRSTIGVSSGKWYAEVLIVSATGSPANLENMVGVCRDGVSITNYVGGDANGWGYFGVNGNKYNNGSGSAYGASYTVNDVIGIALDLDAGTLVFYKNGASQGTAYSSLSGTFYFAFSGTSSAQSRNFSVNFGQRAFAYTAPSGFKALCTQNLPTPTIGATSTTQAGKYFNPVLYTADTAGGKTISGVGFQPDLVWIKNRNNVEEHYWTDAVRGFGGAGTGKFIKSNSTAAESALGDITFAVNSDGFQITDTNYNAGELYFNGRTYAAWNWKANGAGSSNTAGTITSTVSANTTSGFSVVTFSIPGSGTSDTVGHGLGVAPSMVILKPRTAGTSWGVYHSGLTSAAYYLTLQTTNAQASSNSWWNSTAPTSSVFTIGATWYGTTNAVAYCFANVEGYSRAFSYTGNGSTDGPFVFLNFRPRFVLWKRSDGAESWWINDTSRLGYNGDNRALFPNLSNAENTANNLDILSNGFKIRGSGGEVNASGGTYIGFAFAENPFKYSLGR